jgi:hypothetical protein
MGLVNKEKQLIKFVHHIKALQKEAKEEYNEAREQYDAGNYTRDIFIHMAHSTGKMNTLDEILSELVYCELIEEEKEK